MEYIVICIILYLLFYFGFKYYKQGLMTKQEHFIADYLFPNKVTEMILKEYPHLTDEDTALVIKGLKEYFIICHRAKKKMVSMPSQVVDVAWHEFILFTKEYHAFCKKSLGRFLHHTPAEAMKSQTIAQDGIKLAWKLACQREGIRPSSPNRLPLLFALDSMLNIPDGFKYALDCKNSSSGGYCASHIGCGGSGCSGSVSDGGAGCGSGCGGS